MLRLTSLMALGILCVVQSAPLWLRISDRKTDPVNHDEDHSTRNRDSLNFSSLPHTSLCPGHHNYDKAKQPLHPNSKLSKNEVLEWDDTEIGATPEGRDRLERQLKKDDRKYAEWTPEERHAASRPLAMERRRTEPISSHASQKNRSSRVGDISKNPHKRRKRSPIKTKSPQVLHDRHVHIGRLGKRSQSRSGRTGERRSKTRVRNGRTEAHEAFDSTRLLKRRQAMTAEDDVSTDVSYDDDDDDAFADEEDESKVEGDLEESVQKRQSDEVMISKSVLNAMSERILARVAEFIGKNAGKDKQSSNSTVPAAVPGVSLATTVANQTTHVRWS